MLVTLVLAHLALAAAQEESLEERLWRAAKAGDVEEITALLEAGADVDARTEFDATALYFAASNDHAEACGVLADAGAALDVADNFYGNTPIGMAGWLGYPDPVRVLIDRGSTGGVGALFAAAGNGHADVVAAVVESMDVQQGVLDSACATAASSGFPDVVDVLVALGASEPAGAAPGTGAAEATAGRESAAAPLDDDVYVPVVEPLPWDRFRGPGGTGIADGQHPPVRWDLDSGERVRWRVETPGLGHSSPVVWGNKVFVTTAVGEEPDTGTFQEDRGWIGSAEEDYPHRYQVLCYRLEDGELLWSTTVHEGVPAAERHWKASHANCTVAVDDERVVAFFGSEGLHVLDHDGKILWQRDLGLLDAGWFVDDSFGWGFASSPIIWRDRVIVQCDVSGPDFVAAFALADGKELWRAERDELPAWGTPVTADGPEGPEVVFNATNGIRSYDPRSGDLLWNVSGNSKITVSSPVIADGVAYISGGYQRPSPIYPVQLGSMGDLTLADGATSSDAILWSNQRDGVYQPTPLAYGGLLYLLRGNGVLSCFDALTGERLYRERVIAGGSAHTSSPVGADGYLYITSESGEVYVVRAGEEFELVAENRVGDRCLTTPAISNGVLVFRTIDELVAVSRR
jgi:outer membrane protein assembly factor BamB